MSGGGSRVSGGDPTYGQEGQQTFQWFPRERGDSAGMMIYLSECGGFLIKLFKALQKMGFYVRRGILIAIAFIVFLPPSH